MKRRLDNERLSWSAVGYMEYHVTIRNPVDFFPASIKTLYKRDTGSAKPLKRLTPPFYPSFSVLETAHTTSP